MCQMMYKYEFKVEWKVCHVLESYSLLKHTPKSTLTMKKKNILFLFL